MLETEPWLKYIPVLIIHFIWASFIQVSSTEIANFFSNREQAKTASTDIIRDEAKTNTFHPKSE